MNRFMTRILVLASLQAMMQWAAVSVSHAKEAVTNSMGTRVSVWPGKQADGSMLLPNQWSLRPTGRQIELRDFPVNIAVHPKGRYVAVLHSGHSVNVVTIVDLASERAASHLAARTAYNNIGLPKSPLVSFDPHQIDRRHRVLAIVTANGSSTR